MSVTADNQIDQTDVPPVPPAEAPAAPAAEPPLTVIEPRPGWHVVDLRELWRFRELLFFLVWRDVKVRYKQTALGAAWAVLQPLATMGAFVLVLGRIAARPDAALPYPVFVLSGLVPWLYFAAAVGSAGNSVVANDRLVTKVYFPRLIVPLSAVGAALFDFLIAFAMLLVLLPFFGVWPGWGLLAVPLVVAVVTALAAGLGTHLAALTVKYRDFRAVVPLALQLWMFLTPSIFLQGWDMLGPRVAAAVWLNPMHGAVTNFRAAVGGLALDWPALGVSAAWAAAALAAGGLYFRRVEQSFADII